MVSSNTNKWLVAFSVTTGAVMAAVDTSVLNIATPHLRGVFAATTSEISWISTGYLLAVVMGMPLTGWLCSHYDRKVVCQAGLIVFTIASVLCALSSTLEALVLARVLQGLGAGVLLPVEQVILRQAFPPKEQGVAMGVYGVTVMIGPALGPLLGGVIIDHSHWSMIFLINLPIGLLGFAMVQRFVPAQAPQVAPNTKRVKPDVAGILLLAIALFPLLWLLERGDQYDWFETTSNVVLLGVFTAGFLMFCAHELMCEKPAVNLRILTNSAFSSAMLMSFLLGLVVAATLFVLPIFMQDVLGFSATTAGVALMPRALAMMVAFPLVGYLYNRVPTQVLLVSGLALGFYSAFLMTGLTHEAGIHDVIWLQVLQGIAISLILTPLSTYALQQVQVADMPAAAGLAAFSRQLGSALGIAIFASLLSHYELFIRGAVIHNINPGDPLLIDRFSNVIQYFYISDVISNVEAFQRGLDRLNGRLSLQVTVLAYERVFGWIAVSFVVMILCLLLMRKQRSPEPEAVVAQGKAG